MSRTAHKWDGTVWRENTSDKTEWYGHVRRKDDGYIVKMMLRVELPGKRKRGRPKRMFMDVVKEDMAEVEVREEDIEDRINWRWKIRKKKMLSGSDSNDANRCLGRLRIVRENVADFVPVIDGRKSKFRCSRPKLTCFWCEQYQDDNTPQTPYDQNDT